MKRGNEKGNNTPENEKLLFCAWDSNEILRKKLNHQQQIGLMHREETIYVAGPVNILRHFCNL